MTYPTPNTSSAGGSGCTCGDRFGKHFKKCRNREGHVKASVLPSILCRHVRKDVEL